MKFLMILISAALLVAGCERDDFETKPKLSVSSSSPDVVPVGGSLTVSLEYTDKEGDVDSSIFVVRRRENSRDNSPTKERTFDLDIAQFPNNTSGEIEVNLDYTLLTFNNSPFPIPGGLNQPDTLSLRFFVVDEKGNRSDTVALDKNIVVIR